MCTMLIISPYWKLTVKALIPTIHRITCLLTAMVSNFLIYAMSFVSLLCKPFLVQLVRGTVHKFFNFNTSIHTRCRAQALQVIPCIVPGHRMILDRHMREPTDGRRWETTAFMQPVRASSNTAPSPQLHKRGTKRPIHPTNRRICSLDLIVA